MSPDRRNRRNVGTSYGVPPLALTRSLITYLSMQVTALPQQAAESPRATPEVGTFLRSYKEQRRR